MSFDSGRLSHAYITDESFADTLAMAVVCSDRTGARPCRKCSHCDKASRNIHPDITIVGKRDDKFIVSVDQIRELKKDVYIVPNEAMQKAYIVNDADSMNPSAQNAFLQVLEEPPAHAVFILSTKNPAALFDTVRSRCVELKTQSPAYSDKDKDVDPSAPREEDHEELKGFIGEFLNALAGNDIKLMECMFRLDKFDRQTFYDFITLAREQIVSALRNDPGNKSHIDRKTLVTAESVLLKAGDMLDLSVNAGHISGYICASLVKNTMK